MPPQAAAPIQCRALANNGSQPGSSAAFDVATCTPMTPTAARAAIRAGQPDGSRRVTSPDAAEQDEHDDSGGQFEQDFQRVSSGCWMTAWLPRLCRLVMPAGQPENYI